MLETTQTTHGAETKMTPKGHSLDVLTNLSRSRHPKEAAAKPSGATRCNTHHIPFAYLRAGYPRAVYTRPTAGPTMRGYHD